jgi:hypothetical protein
MLPLTGWASQGLRVGQVRGCELGKSGVTSWASQGRELGKSEVTSWASHVNVDFRFAFGRKQSVESLISNVSNS